MVFVGFLETGLKGWVVSLVSGVATAFVLGLVFGVSYGELGLSSGFLVLLCYLVFSVLLWGFAARRLWGWK